MKGRSPEGLRAAAVVFARNEEFHIEYTLRDVIAEGCDVVLIDNDSTDSTVSRAEPFLGHGLLSIEHLPYEGMYALRPLLEAVAWVVDSLDHDWVVRIDADEWLMSPFEGETLRDRMAVAGREGFNVLNFDEFVFVAGDDVDLRGLDYRRRMLRYYFFEPKYPRLMRAWKLDSGVGMGDGSGHLLQGDVRRYPHDMVLRHYLSLGHAHVCQKYIGLVYAKDELERGWHKNRIGLTEGSLRVRESPALKQLDHWESRRFDRSTPSKVHFWDPAWGT